MANWLEAICVDDKYQGTLIGQGDKENGLLYGLPYLRIEQDGQFKTASTIDGHRFASEYILKAEGKFESNGKKEGKSKPLYEYIKDRLEASPDGKTIPPANVPRIFEVVCELDPLSLVHGFQISLTAKEKLTFVGLRSARALSGCIVALGAERLGVPGVYLDPIGTGEAGQAIFRKERITAKRIEARFTLDVGIIQSMLLSSDAATCRTRRELLIALSIWKVARLIDLFEEGHRLRTECDLTLDGEPSFRTKARAKGPDSKDASVPAAPDFPYEKIASESLKDLIAAAKLPDGPKPRVLQFQG